MRAFDLPMAILLHVAFALVGLSIMGMGALLLFAGAVGAGVGSVGSRLTS